MFLGFLKVHFMARICYENAPSGTEQDLFGDGGDADEGDDDEDQHEDEDALAVEEAVDDGVTDMDTEQQQEGGCCIKPLLSSNWPQCTL